ncbi:MAG: murein L,D-transpeptidase, partial [Nitrospirae bacterium]
GIHGMKYFLTKEEEELLKGFNWTKGCIALPNEELIELRNYCSVGTKVVIKK